MVEAEVACESLEGRVQREGQERTVDIVGAEGNRQPEGSSKKRQTDLGLNPGAWHIQAKRVMQIPLWL